MTTSAHTQRGPTLELGCGTGRVLVPPARAGATITGVDASSQMLTVCRCNVAAQSDDVRERVTLAAGALESFALGRRFSLITIPFRPFQYLLGVEDQLACLSRVKEHLNDDGRLILDVFDPDPSKLTGENLGQERTEEEPVELPDGSRLVRSQRIDPCDQRSQVWTSC